MLEEVRELRALAERLRLGVDEACAARLLARFSLADAKRFLVEVEAAARRRLAREAAEAGRV